MPVEAFIKTADRTVGSYLTKPLFDQVARAFVETIMTILPLAHIFR